MKIEEGRLCRLCLRTDPNEIFQEVGDTIKRLLDALLLKLNFQISEECVVCSNCMESIQKCFDFISTCRNADSFIIPFCNAESESKLNLKQVYIQMNTITTIGDIPMDKEICRFCMKLNKNLSYRALIEVDKEMLQKYIPDLNFNLTEDPVVCDSCLNSLKFYFQFIQTCNDTEEKIIKYCKFEATDSGGPINLCKVLQYTQNMLKYERDIAGVNASDLDEVCCDTKENDVKTEMTIKKENAEFDREYAKIDVKMDVDENVMKVEINEEPLNLQDEELKMIYKQDASETEQSDFESFRDAPTSSQLIMKNITTHNPKDSVTDQDDCDFNRHNKWIHRPSEIVVYNCDQCAFKTKYRHCLKQHKLVHQELSEVAVYKCGSCSFMTKHISSLNSHNKWIHQYSEVTEYICSICEHKTKDKNGLKKHMLVHQDLSEVTVYTCEKCPYVTKRKINLKKHMLVHQELSEAKVYKCESCSYVTKYKYGLDSHNQRMHRSSEITEYKIYNCDRCSFNTKYKHSLKEHLLNHQELNTHMLTDRSSEITVYICSICSHKTKDKNDLRKHMLIHQEVSEVTVYTCEKCSYVTKRKRNLKNHMLVHQELSEARVYKCESCSYITKYKRGLSAHNKRIHRPSEVTYNVYNCSECSFTTKYRNSFISHNKHIHRPSETTEYNCDQCTFKTNYKNSLKNHVSIIHGELK